ncbi:hypothetical protein AYJ54_06995 [Bradyrhizobium centrolobii]|uniref:Uncharacterized protein n=1 Tax=Bradyrhizobium centrolobii TaxID=1505087 RepID=A0A176YXW2_9BRAD|nr:hypothetical protein AYJ54_06995 [Bradyrhizobium centrolobii]
MAVAVVMVGMVAMLVVVMMVVTMIMRGMIVVVVIMAVMIMMMVMIVMVMSMIMMRMIIMAMRVVVGMTRIGIGAAFGIERRLDLDHARTEPLHHRFDDMVAADAQALGHDLRRQMAVAEMPGDADEVVRITAADFQQRLRRRDHLDQPAVLQHQGIAAAKCDGVFEVEQEFEPARARHRHAAAVSIVEIEHDRIRRGFREAVLSLDLRRPDHALYPVTESRPFPA